MLRAGLNEMVARWHDLKSGGESVAKRDKIIIVVLVVLIIGGVIFRFSGCFSDMERIPPQTEDNIPSQADPSAVLKRRNYLRSILSGRCKARVSMNCPPEPAFMMPLIKRAALRRMLIWKKINLARPVIDGEQVYILNR